MNKFFVFDIRSNNDQLKEEFYKFFRTNDLHQLFLEEDGASPISVTDLDLRSIVNTKKSTAPFLEIRDILHMHTGAKKYHSSLLRLLDEPQSFRKFVNNLTRLNAYYTMIQSPKRKENFWNIVFYDGKDDKPANIFY